MAKRIAPHQEVSYGALFFNTAVAIARQIEERCVRIGVHEQQLTASIVAPSVIVLNMKNATQ